MRAREAAARGRRVWVKIWANGDLVGIVGARAAGVCARVLHFIFDLGTRGDIKGGPYYIVIGRKLAISANRAGRDAEPAVYGGDCRFVLVALV